LKTLGDSVDWAIVEDYTGALGTVRADGCASAPKDGATRGCGQFGQGLDVMCLLPPANVMIGLISPQGGNGGTNVFAGAALDAVDSYGYRAVAIWPDDNGILNSSHISPNGSDWYGLLAGFLAKP
jgi:hypothetical protein